MAHRIAASRIIDASADDVFAVVTDISRLPAWNTGIAAVIEQPDFLEPGAQWIIEMHALGQSWHSRSVVEALDTAGRSFAYRSATDDGNPSYSLWTWIVADHVDGALVTVACELHPHSLWRRMLLVRIRSHQLTHTELPHSLIELESAVQRPSDTLLLECTGGQP